MKNALGLIAPLLLTVLILASCATAKNTGYATADPVLLTEAGIPVEGITDELALIEAMEKLRLPIYNGVLRSPGSLTVDEAVMHTVAAADMTELAMTFSPEKSLEILDDYEIARRGDSEYDSFTAVGITVGLIDPAWYVEASRKKTPDAGDISYLLHSALKFRGETSSFLGRVSDPGIYKAVADSWERYHIVQGVDILNTVDEAVIEGVVTGYNVLNSLDTPEFNPGLTITYGHNDIKHALQLIGLLASEEIDANVDFQGKTSAFLYLKEWGQPVESETFKVKQIPNGNYVAYAKEYNLIFEFATAADKEDFNKIILAYAKKDAADETGLIFGSWWQPLYFSSAPMGEGYRQITDHVIVSGPYEAHPFSLNENADAVDAGFRAIDSDIKIESTGFWVNQAFYNYLTGDFK